jgi:transposase
VLEDLTGIRKQRKGKKINGWLSNWTFWQLEQFLGYKAEAAGKQVVKVDARYTSQKCSECGMIDKKSRNKSHYKCVGCGHTEHADINAAKNIRSNHTLSTAEKKVEQALVNMPHVSIAPSGVLDTSCQPCADGN